MFDSRSRSKFGIGCAFAVLAGGVVWSTPASAEPGGVVISELHYHPASEDEGDEFIELANTADTAVDLSGWSFSAGIEGVLSGVIPAGGYAVFAPDPTTFAAVYGFPPDGAFGGRLSNGGEEITLLDAGGAVVDSVIYDDANPWSPAPDGSGPSLELRDLGFDNTLAANWGRVPWPVGPRRR
jgi:hypothetical protein